MSAKWYGGLDPLNPQYMRIINTCFVNQSQPEIWKHFHKIDLNGMIKHR